MRIPESYPFVVSPRGESGLGLAYMSAAPIFGGYHAVTLDLTASSLYVEHRESRPYLLLLTPVTALADVTITLAWAMIIPFAPGYCHYYSCPGGKQ